MKKITMLYLHGESADFQKIDPELENYYNLLLCRCIDIVSIKFHGKYYDVICDDEGLLNQPPLSYSIISKEGHPMIAGNVLICNSEDGYETTLTAHDMLNLANCLCWTIQNNELTAALVAD